MSTKITQYLKQLKRVDSVEEGLRFNEDVLLLPRQFEIISDDNSNVSLIGFENITNNRAKDLLRIINVDNATQMKYTETNIISPSVYVHTLKDIPWHITTQGFLVTNISEKTKNYIIHETSKSKKDYGKHELDSFWLPCSKPLEQVEYDDLVCIFNRRVSGWDGSIDKPVIELLGAGGHLQAIWNDKNKNFVNRTFEDNLKKEFCEEIGLQIDASDIQVIGGFENKSTHELVIFMCIYITESEIPSIQKYAFDNINEDTNGIYLGTFIETMDYYRRKSSLFAGGKEASQTNFPNNRFIIDKICKLFSI